MQLKVFSIRDQKSETFHTPFFQKTIGEAERNFTLATQDTNSNINKFPEDYDLWYLGQYDDQEGKLIPTDTPQHIVKAVNCLKATPGKATMLDETRQS